MAENSHLGEIFTQLRKERKYSLRRMAQVCGVSRESIRKYEMGSLIPSNQTVNQMMLGLGIDPVSSKEAVAILTSVYHARRERDSGASRSFGASAQVEIEALLSDQSDLEDKAARLANLFFEEVGSERRSESFEFYLRSKILAVLRS